MTIETTETNKTTQATEATQTTETTETPIDLSSPDLTKDERAAVMGVLKTRYLSRGEQIKAFEQAFCKLTGWGHAIGVSSGTAGLHLCVRAAGISEGDLVVTTPFSFVASANVLLFERAAPVFVDVDPRTGNIDPALLKEAARDLMQGGAAAQRWLPRKGVEEGGVLKAVLPVDVFGQPADMDPIVAAAREHSLTVIEDSCEALGAEYKGRQAGTLGDYGVFAFYPNKQITTGEGGMIITDDQDAADYMRALHNQGRSPGDTWLQHTHLGYNYRLNEMSAALGRVQMGRMEKLLANREKVAGWYAERLVELPGVEAPQVMPETTRMSWFVYVVRFAPEIDRKQTSESLKARGIPTRPYFLPIHLQPYMKERFGYREGDFPVTEDLGKRGLALPFSGVMTEGQVDRVCHALGEVLQDSL